MSQPWWTKVKEYLLTTSHIAWNIEKTPYNFNSKLLIIVLYMETYYGWLSFFLISNFLNYASQNEFYRLIYYYYFEPSTLFCKKILSPILSPVLKVPCVPSLLSTLHYDIKPPILGVNIFF
jgi:hypothetical protein